jgi:hypothetical protein
VQFRSEFAGTFFLGELLALLLVSQAIHHRRLVLADRFMRLLLISGLVGFGALVASDLWHGTSSQDRLKGWGEIGVGLIGLAVMRMLVARHPERVRLALLGLGIGYALRLAFVDVPSPWRLGGAYALALFALLGLTVAPIKLQSSLALIVPIVLATVSLVVSARGLGAILIGTAAYVAATRFFRIRSGAILTNKQTAIGVMLAIAFAGFIAAAYGWAAGAGALGEEQRMIYESQSSGELGVMIGGRTSLVGSAIAISDSPFIGHGSRQRDEEYSERTRAFLEAKGYQGAFVGYDTATILTHGALLAAWVTSGVLGILFWIVVLRVAFRALLAAHNLSAPWQPLVAFLALQVGWDTALNGFGGVGKLALPTLLIFLITMTDQASIGRPRPRLRSRMW